MIIPFQPDKGSTVNINVSNVSQSIMVYPEDHRPISIRIMNNGSATIWVDYGDSAVTVSQTSGFPVGPGVTEVITMDNVKSGPVYVAAIAAAATGIVYFTPGKGL